MKRLPLRSTPSDPDVLEIFPKENNHTKEKMRKSSKYCMPARTSILKGLLVQYFSRVEKCVLGWLTTKIKLFFGCVELCRGVLKIKYEDTKLILENKSL